MSGNASHSEKSARLSSDSRANLLNGAATLFNSGKVAEAETAYAKVLKAAPTNVKALIGAALCATTLRRDATTALKLLKQAETVSPNNSHVHQSRAATLNMLGDFPGAVAAARKAIALNQNAAHAYVNLTDSQKIKAGDTLFEQAESALSSKALSDEERTVIHFALGKAYQDTGNWAQAFSNFQAGNALKPSFTGIENYRAVAERQKALFTPKFCKNLMGAAKTIPRPIFVIGMPRSGTTLLERMLAAHPQVSTAGERPEINQISASFFQNSQAARPDLPPAHAIHAAMTKTNLAKLARDYITKILGAADAKSPNIIDKMPTNFWNLGIISAIFADAPILHMRRHPLDTCLSNYLANFRTGLDYSNRLETLGQYYRIYDDLMAYWAEALPTRILQVDYETLVSSPETEARRILDFCDLDWCENCVRPEQTDGVIATASRWQARQKINTGSIEKWRRYENQLAPLVAALGGEAWVHAHEARRFGEMQSD